MLSGRPPPCLAKKDKEERGAEVSLPAESPSLPVPSTSGSPAQGHPSPLPPQPRTPALCWVEVNGSKSGTRPSAIAVGTHLSLGAPRHNGARERNLYQEREKTTNGGKCFCSDVALASDKKKRGAEEGKRAPA